MTRTTAIATACCVALISGFLWFRFGYLVKTDLPSKLEAYARAPSGQRIDLSDLAPTPWTRVVLVGPYNSQDGVDQALGFPWPQYQDFGIEMSDTRSLIILADAQSVVIVEELPRCLPDIDNELQSKAILRNQAVFRTVDRDGCTMLVRANAKAP